MSMSRKDFIAIADAMRYARQSVLSDDAAIIKLRVLGVPPKTVIEVVDRYVLNALMDALKRTNPSFDRQKFAEACGKEY